MGELRWTVTTKEKKEEATKKQRVRVNIFITLRHIKVVNYPKKKKKEEEQQEQQQKIRQINSHPKG